FADQPFWGARVTRLGVGAHVPFAKLDQRTLSDGLRKVLAEDVRARAAELGKKLRAEDGATAAVEAIVNRLGPPRAQRAVA
ncbi:MAG TPA: hypothetical protein VM580_32385, partial [Labilithrix sp.]|nr:hypothetical protein [Labilithrix sp.]